MKHYLPKPTEKDLQEELNQFNNAISNYQQTLLIKKQKQQGTGIISHTITMQEIEQFQQQQWRELYHKIPTLYLIELQELLNQKHITL